MLSENSTVPQAHPEEYEIMFRAEESLWWYAGMERITRALLTAAYGPKAVLRILDAGCGTGGALRYLCNWGQVTGMDFSPLALGFCAQRRADGWAQGAITQLPFANAQFDLVTSFDVLYMLPRRASGQNDDALALAEFARVLHPGGRALVRVAAFDGLRGQHDRAWASQHRYTTHELAEMMRRAGFTLEKASYANMWLFPLAAAKRLSERFLPAQTASDTALSPGRWNTLMAQILSSEANLIAHGQLPFGLSVVAMGRKN